MTHEERIEAMARAIYEAGVQDPDDRIDYPFRPDELYYKGIAKAALVAAGVEEMVREAAIEAWQSCGYNASEYYKGGFDPAAIETIVRVVMGK